MRLCVVVCLFVLCSRMCVIVLFFDKPARVVFNVLCIVCMRVALRLVCGLGASRVRVCVCVCEHEYMRVHTHTLEKPRAMMTLSDVESSMGDHCVRVCACVRVCVFVRVCLCDRATYMHSMCVSSTV